MDPLNGNVLLRFVGGTKGRMAFAEPFECPLQRWFIEARRKMY